jgi:hypothetical protein
MHGKGTDWQRRLGALLGGLLLALTALLVAGAPAHAADYNSCEPKQQMTFAFVGTTTDGYTGVSRSQTFQFNYSTPGCPRPYEGNNSDCGTFRLVVLTSPQRNYQSNIRGPWFRSCWTPQAAASQWDGWVWHSFADNGDWVFYEGRAWQSGHDMTCCGYAWW